MIGKLHPYPGVKPVKGHQQQKAQGRFIGFAGLLVLHAQQIDRAAVVPRRETIAQFLHAARKAAQDIFFLFGGGEQVIHPVAGVETDAPSAELDFHRLPPFFLGFVH